MWIWLMMANWLQPKNLWIFRKRLPPQFFCQFKEKLKKLESKVFDRKSDLDEKLLGIFFSLNFLEIRKTSWIRQVFFWMAKCFKRWDGFLNEAAETEVRSWNKFVIIFALYSPFRKWLWALWLLTYGQFPGREWRLIIETWFDSSIRSCNKKH